MIDLCPGFAWFTLYNIDDAHPIWHAKSMHYPAEPTKKYVGWFLRGLCVANSMQLWFTSSIRFVTLHLLSFPVMPIHFCSCPFDSHSRPSVAIVFISSLCLESTWMREKRSGISTEVATKGNKGKGPGKFYWTRLNKFSIFLIVHRRAKILQRNEIWKHKKPACKHETKPVHFSHSVDRGWGKSGWTQEGTQGNFLISSPSTQHYPSPTQSLYPDVLHLGKPLFVPKGDCIKESVEDNGLRLQRATPLQHCLKKKCEP